MRIRHSLVIIAFISAVLGATVSPGIADPRGTKVGKVGEPGPRTNKEYTGWFPDWQKALDDQRQQELAKSIAKRGTNVKFGPDDKGVVTGNHLKGTSTTRNGDWSSGGHWTGTKTVVAPKTIAATATPQTRYQPVQSLGVKSSVPSTPQPQKR